MGNLTDDPVFRATTFVVIDFEATTPTGHHAQPIEVAALALRFTSSTCTPVGRYQSLIRPPAFAPITPADTAQTGLRAEDLHQAPTPDEALGCLDRHFTPGTPYLLVAQHAATEANLIHHQREHCPALSRIDFLDTIPFAKRMVPHLPNYRLDTLLAHFRIPQPQDRHRAYADVEVTAQVFLRLVHDADQIPNLDGLADLMRIAGKTAKSNLPVQDQLFEL